MKIKISVKMMKLKFNVCNEKYITSICKGRCCKQYKESLITILDNEVTNIEKAGGTVILNRLQLDKNTNQCPFKKDGLCSIHSLDIYPFGCSISPFALNKNNTLIIRHRYIVMGCYGTKKAVPVYKAHRWSLEHIFKDKTDEIIKKISRTKKDIIVDLDDEIYNKMKHKELFLQKQIFIKGIV